MDITIHPARLQGEINAIPSKSHAHRVLICAAFSDSATKILCAQTNQDIEATADCLRALGASITRTDDGYIVDPIAGVPSSAMLNCRESGSTLRFMLPIVGALGVDATFQMTGRLPQRPLSPLWEEMERMGCRLDRPTCTTVRCQNKLRTGNYVISGGVSSQYITGLLFALSLLEGESTLTITGKLESRPYIDLTKKVLSDFDVTITDKICGAFPFHTPGTVEIEGDWSNAAFFLAAAQMENFINIAGLSDFSVQGDRAIAALLPVLKEQKATISAADIPDLVPIMAVFAAAHHGAVFTDVARLRIKESDRVETVCGMMKCLGAEAVATENTLTVYPASFTGCTIDAAGDHRIAMAAVWCCSRRSTNVMR